MVYVSPREIVNVWSLSSLRVITCSASASGNVTTTNPSRPPLISFNTSARMAMLAFSTVSSSA